MRLARKTNDLAAEPIGNFRTCTRAILASQQGPCRVGQILHQDDPRVVAVPEAFDPVMTLVVSPKKD